MTSPHGRPAIPGAPDVVVPEAAIRARLRELMAAGILPSTRPGHVWAGPATVPRPCTGCGLPLGRGEIEFELVSPARATLHFHRRCLDLWTLELDAGGQ